MNLVFHESYSSVKPDLLDTTSSRTSVYIRKDVKKTTQPADESIGSEECTMYVYQECILSKEEYENYKLELQMENTIDLELCTLDELKTYWKEKVNKQCEEAIYTGVDVETTQGTEHFSLTTTDQLNITGILFNFSIGAITSYAYHADGKLCREFTKDEIEAIAAAATSTKFYYTTMCNHVHSWIDRCESKEEVQSISLTSTLPDDLQASFTAIVNTVSKAAISSTTTV